MFLAGCGEQEPPVVRDIYDIVSYKPMSRKSMQAFRLFAANSNLWSGLAKTSVESALRPWEELRNKKSENNSIRYFIFGDPRLDKDRYLFIYFEFGKADSSNIVTKCWLETRHY